jgi:hypothetical protein
MVVPGSLNPGSRSIRAVIVIVTMTSADNPFCFRETARRLNTKSGSWMERGQTIVGVYQRSFSTAFRRDPDQRVGRVNNCGQ